MCVCICVHVGTLTALLCMVLSCASARMHTCTCTCTVLLNYIVFDDDSLLTSTRHECVFAVCIELGDLQWLLFPSPAHADWSEGLPADSRQS